MAPAAGSPLPVPDGVVVYRDPMRRIAAAAMLVVTAACNSGADDPTIVAGDTTTTSSTAPSPPGTAPAASPPVSTPPVAERAHLTAVRAAVHEGADRVVFEFEPVLPGYRVDWVQRPVVQDGSGDQVAVAGAAILEVRAENASSVRFEGDQVIPTYTGPKRFSPPATSVVEEVVLVGDFEGVLTWVVGLRRQLPSVRVTTLDAPSRLVVGVPAGE